MTDKIGIMDPKGINPNPLTNAPYSDSYKEEAKRWSMFPTYEKRNHIMKSMEKYQLLFIVSGTGSGKTVLLPKYALHYTNYQGKVGITLPKRKAVTSSANYAALTLDVELGKDVGKLYKGSEKSMVSDENKILYMTDGILILKFRQDPLLSDYKVIIIDEAHERKPQIDLILLLLKTLLISGKRPDIRVIIMSATIDSKKYQNYFAGIDSEIINISGAPNYEITTKFLTKPSKSYMTDGLALINKLIDRGVDKDMLFFITSSNEAFILCKKIRELHPSVYCLELFADMDHRFEEYASSPTKYKELGNYTQKLMMATNVAESSITFDGLKYVIDSCHELHASFDPKKYANIFAKRLITRAQALQRRGRVGRTETGICYPLITETEFENLEKYPEPDILKEDLTMTLLQLSRMTESNNINDGIKTLHQLMDVPDKPFFDIAVKLYNQYDMIQKDGTLDKIGYYVSQFTSTPINRALFIIYAYQRGCAYDASIIITMIDKLSGKLENLVIKKDPICKSECKKKSSKNLLKSLVDKSSDHMTFLNIFREFDKQDKKADWAKKYGLRYGILMSVKKNFLSYFYKISNIINKNVSELSRLHNLDITDDYNLFLSDSDTDEYDDLSNNKYQMSRQSKDTDHKLMDALVRSHQHQLAKNMTTVFPPTKTTGKISGKSVIVDFNKGKQSKKKRIYLR